MAANSNILLTACTFTSPKHVAGIGTSSLAIVALRKPNNFHLLKLLNLHLLKNVGDGVIFVFSRHVSAPIPIVHVGEHWHLKVEQCRNSNENAVYLCMVSSYA